MAENLIYLIDQAKPDTKFVIWAHNGHVSVENLLDQTATLGSTLREKYGQTYFSFGLECNQGSFLTRIIQPDKVLGDFMVFTLPLAPAGSFPWQLARANRGNLILNLRAPAGDARVEQWLKTPFIVHNAGWGYEETDTYYSEVIVGKKYDGIIFIDTTAANHPTVNALQTVARREGL